MQQFHSITEKVKIGNKLVVVLIVFEYDYENELLEIGFESNEEQDQYLSKFETGEYSNLFLRVTASALGEKGCDLLGQVHVVSKNADNDLIEIAESHGMINNAIGELVKNCEARYLELKAVFE